MNEPDNPQQPDAAPSAAAVVPEVVAALGPAIERGHHIALVAAEGAGLGHLYATVAMRDLREGGRGFILTATPDRARRCARAMYPLAREAGLDLLALSHRDGPGDGGGIAADVVVATPAAALTALRRGDLPSAELRLVAVESVSALSGEWPAVESLLQACADDARKIAVTAEPDERFEDLLIRRLPRARRWPAELFAEAGATAASAASTPPLRIAAAGGGERLAALVGILRGLAKDEAVARVRVWAVAPQGASEVAAALAVEGFDVSLGPAEAGIGVSPLPAAGAPSADGSVAGGAGASPGEVDAAILVGLPVDIAPLAHALGAGRRRFAVVAPLHVRQLQLMAARLGWDTRAWGEPPPEEIEEDVGAFRRRVSEAVDQLDLAANTLLIGPLLEEHGSARVAAALTGLLRSEGRTAPPRGEGGETAGARATRPAWTRVFVNIGRRDGAGPGDLVGAITGETPIAGAQIGKIEVHQTFALVDVDSLVVEDVIRGLSGSRIKGRDVVARLDRGRP